MNLPALLRQPRVRRLILLSVLAFGVLWMGLAARSIINGRSAALTGLDRLETLRDNFEIEQLESGDLRGELSAASDDFAAAQGHLRAPWVFPLRIVPWVGTQIRSADALSSSAATVSGSLADATATVLDIKRDAQTGDTDKAQASQQLLQLTTSTRLALANLDLGPSTGLTSALVNARSRFDAELRSLETTLADAETALEGIAEFLGGPTTYLLLSANTSEMRAGSGRFLIAGSIVVENGTLRVENLISPEEILLSADAVPIADRDFAANWAQLEPTSDLRNLASTPRFDVTAELAVDMWEAAVGQRVEGVLVIDPIALQAVLGASGSVEVDGMSIDESNVLEHVLVGQYWESDIPTRRRRQQALAREALSSAVGQNADLLGLAEALRNAVEGRHLLAWSSSEKQQTAWAVIGVDGLIDQSSLMVSLINTGFNKLDTFVTLEVAAQMSGEADLELAITVANNSTPDLPDYVFGPFASQGLDRGEYRGILVVNAPGAATDLSIDGITTALVAGPDGPSQVVATEVQVAPGSTATYRIRFSLPAGQQTIAVEPSARVPATRWTWLGTEWLDEAARTIDPRSGAVGPAPQTSTDTGPLLGQPLVPPTPTVSASGPDQAVVAWRISPADTRVVLWEQTDGGEWSVVADEAPAISQSVRSLVPDAGRPCYRTSLFDQNQPYSSTACLDP